MANLKINHVESSDFDCIPNEVPDVPDMDEVESVANDAGNVAEAQNYVKAPTASEGEQPRKMFANKKANIALIVAGVITVIIIALLFIVAKTNLIV